MFKADISCNGIADGNAGVEVSGGTPPYTYKWSTGAETSTIGNIGPGTYTVTVTDSNEIEAQNGVNLADISPVAIELIVTDGTCGNKGIIEAIVTGGIGPFQYAWSTGSFQTSIQDLEEGEYSLTVTDRGSCDISESTSVLVYGEGLQLSEEFTNPTCTEASDGKISISQTGGQDPIEYLWNDGSQGTSIENLKAGTYSISAQDALGCTDGFVIILRDPDELIVEIINQNNSLFARVEGGTPPYSYEWSNGVTGSAVISNLATGEYYLTVTDNNGCMADDVGDVLGPLSAESIAQIESFQMFPSIVKDQLQVQLQLLQSEQISFDIFSTNGQLLNKQIVQGQNLNLSLNNILNLQSGLYFMRISSNEGWSFTEKFIKQ